MAMHRTNICLPEMMVEYLKEVSEEKGISMADSIRRIIDDWIEKKKSEDTKSTQN